MNLREFLLEHKETNRVKILRVYLAGFACGAILMAIIGIAGVLS